MVSVMRNGIRAECKFQKEAWIQAINNGKKIAYSLNYITLEKIKNKLYFF